MPDAAGNLDMFLSVHNLSQNQVALLLLRVLCSALGASIDATHYTLHSDSNDSNNSERCCSSVYLLSAPVFKEERSVVVALLLVVVLIVHC